MGAIGSMRVVVTPRDGVKPWELPAGMWSKVGLLKRLRLKRTISNHILPLLQRLEELYLHKNPKTTARLVGRTLAELEEDDRAIEIGLRLFELALQEGLIEFRCLDVDGNPGHLITEGPVGSCGFSVIEANDHYLERAMEIILRNVQSSQDKAVLDHLGKMKLKDARELRGVRQLAQFDALAIKELKKGLGGNLELLLVQDKPFLDTLLAQKPVGFVRALRLSLGKNFSEILKWDPTFMTAVAEGLDHSAKIKALGPEILSIEDPDVVRAFGTWSMKEAKPKQGEKKKGKTYVTRIAQVKKNMGTQFTMLLTANPDLVMEAGHWTTNEINKMRGFLPHLTHEVMSAMGPLPFDLRVSMLEGLWDRLGRSFVEEDMKTPQGTAVIQKMVKQVQVMMAKGNSGKNLKKMISDTEVLDGAMMEFINKKRFAGLG
ncbi:hypothetical protein V5T82_17980 [Magnetovibrio sp. PR-2]|uniref:hypothetical protein n=1 Tax=Magnetovibrio sp. PR-2 TaxID=3120356 RepID=UPI002FCE30D7